MKKSLVYSYTICILALSACTGHPPQQDNASFQQNNFPSGADIKMPSTLPAQPAAGNPVGGNGIALNPAHGLPGHNCDLDVGAPLNPGVQPAKQPTFSPTQPIATQPIATQPIPTPPLPASNTSNQAGLNPAHGQPGHRCDVAVGASLNAPIQAGAQAEAPKALPIPPKNGSTAGLNPAHGEAGHRCDIAVGAPLNSAKGSPATPGAG